MTPIKNFNGYFITEEGKVFCNLGRGNRRKTDRTVDLYEIKGRPGKTGYLRVYMRDSTTNKRIDRYVHRLVAETFIPNPDGYKYVNHKDCNRNNNSVRNLEWISAKENTQQTEDLGHVVRNDKGRFESRFDYSRYSLLPEDELYKINRYKFVKACQRNMPKGRV